MFREGCRMGPRCLVATVVLLLMLTFTANVRAQLVDCSGTAPMAYPTITAALAVATPGAWITVKGTCIENVNVSNMTNVAIAAPWGETATVEGSIYIVNSTGVTLYGLNVSNPSGWGIGIDSSRNVVLDTCSSSHNAVAGLYVGPGSSANIFSSGSFDNNAGNGINVNDQSYLRLVGYAAPITIKGNNSAGVYVGGGSVFVTYGNTIISDTVGQTVAGQVSGVGIDARAHSVVQLGTIFGPNVIAHNESGGASLQEGVEASFWGGPYAAGNDFQTRIEQNGPFGIAVMFGSQLTLFDSAYITGHVTGVDVIGNSQFFANRNNFFVGNGTGTDPLGAAVRVDGNSQAYFRGGTFTNNLGAAIGAFANSSLDLVGVQFSNTGLMVSCDTSAVLVGDMTPKNGYPHSLVQCASAHTYGGAKRFTSRLSIPKLPDYKTVHDRWRRASLR